MGVPVGVPVGVAVGVMLSENKIKGRVSILNVIVYKLQLTLKTPHNLESSYENVIPQKPCM